MKHPLRYLLLLAFTLPASSLEIRSYNPALHDRFLNFNTGNDAGNPTFLYDWTKFTGLGWFATSAHRQPGLVSPRHAVWATHHVSPVVLGASVKFLASNGAIIQRTVTSMTPIASDISGDSDLSILTFSAALPSTVKPFRYLNLANDAAYIGTPLMVFGFQAKAGQGAIAGFLVGDLDGGGPQGDTKFCRFDYNGLTGTPDDAYLIVGDSGTPSFASGPGGEPAIVGTHSTFMEAGSIIQNYDTFVPNYATKLDAQMAALGYRMRPANFTATTLGLSSVTDPAELRQAYPGSIEFTFANTGGQLTGNAELILDFAAGQAPVSVTASGWVVEQVDADTWSVRKATVAAAESVVVEAAWSSMPALATLTVSATIQSDTASTTLTNPGFALKPTYAAWSAGLPQIGQDDDPDQDGMINLLEYALGGEGNSGSMLLSSGDSILPRLAEEAGNIILSYPERSDAAVRGLSYQVETSTDLLALAGATTLPPGAVSSTQAFVPAVPGFVKRTIIWPADSTLRFARVKVELSE
ncbi:hypothetical protein [Luteolibacter luteus]|uniref:Uncharacterized protein n=1 Tax=Luteolibacter luteus TaxID=2728835 RepID=A0A858RIT5_9BACT|nr:hypothetical protein [Luteolibacter luteus]QJE96491.1 hypothetical protein HHL09_12085 [Luteolibacter luteus]